MERQVTMYGPSTGTTISRRAYNALTFGMVTVAFLVTWVEYLAVQSGALNALLSGGILALILTFALTIGGIVLMAVGKSKQSVALSAAGFALFTLTFGFTLSLTLVRYPVGTIYYAFLITACLSGIFLVLGVTFPEVFSRIGGVLMAALLGLIMVEFVATVFFHANQTWIDYLTIVIFCGFLGYDAYWMSADAPTVPNAIYYASDIFLDVVNVLIRVLAILNDDR